MLYAHQASTRRASSRVVPAYQLGSAREFIICCLYCWFNVPFVFILLVPSILCLFSWYLHYYFFLFILLVRLLHVWQQQT